MTFDNEADPQEALRQFAHFEHTVERLCAMGIIEDDARAILEEVPAEDWPQLIRAVAIRGETLAFLSARSRLR